MLFITGFQYLILTNYKSVGKRTAKAKKPDTMHVPPNLLECSSDVDQFVVQLSI
jgi:hypothetical protein